MMRPYVDAALEVHQHFVDRYGHDHRLTQKARVELELILYTPADDEALLLTAALALPETETQS